MPASPQIRITEPIPSPVACAALAEGLHVEAISRYSTRPPERDGLLLGFASHCPRELRAGVVTLARALRTLTLATSYESSPGLHIAPVAPA